MVGFVRNLLLGLALSVVAGASARAQGNGEPTPPVLPPDFTYHPLAGGASYLEVYKPPQVSLDGYPPAIVFLHGAGSSPGAYRARVASAAAAAGAVAALPKSISNEGWGFAGDSQILAETVRTLLRQYRVAGDRVAIGGHSSGGAYAYLQAYLGEGGWSAVFSLAAPYQPVVALRAGEYRAPIRMYYGVDDWNYQSGAASRLVAQWQRLLIPPELVTMSGFGHTPWPSFVLVDGFRFLTSQAAPPEESFDARVCRATDTRLCLVEERFAVEVSFRDFADRRGAAHPLPIPSDDSGLFWFFTPENWELLVKVLDGCATNGHWWVFAAATTDVDYELRVTDTFTGRAITYRNELGRRAPAITDAGALSTCP